MPPSTDEIAPARLAETEYVSVADPARVRLTRWGRFVYTPRFPDRYDANQLQDCCCAASDAESMLTDLEAWYASTGLGFRKISGHDPATLQALQPILESRGWSVHLSSMLVFAATPERPMNPAVRIEVVDPHTSVPLADLVGRPSERSEGGFAYSMAQESRLGSRTLLAWVDGRPAGTTGWFVVDRIARYRYVFTAPWARRRGVASALVQYIQNQPAVQSQDALTLHCGIETLLGFYEQLGFRRHSVFWEAVRLLGGPAPMDMHAPAR